MIRLGTLGFVSTGGLLNNEALRICGNLVQVHHTRIVNLSQLRTPGILMRRSVGEQHERPPSRRVTDMQRAHPVQQ